MPDDLSEWGPVTPILQPWLEWGFKVPKNLEDGTHEFTHPQQKPWQLKLVVEGGEIKQAFTRNVYETG